MARKRLTAKAPEARGDGRTRIAFRLGDEAIRKLRLISIAESITPRDLVERLILERGRRYVLQDRGGEAGQGESAA